MRADQALVQRGLAPTRSAAQRLIEHGGVRWRSPSDTAGWTVPKKSGEDVPDDCEFEITDDAELRWASRGGLKLDGAIAKCGIEVKGRFCLDIGQGTGGFTDVLLARGAAHVTGIDVGRAQIAQRLRDDPRVTAFEGLNARNVSAEDLGEAVPEDGYTLLVGDLSFISSVLVYPALMPLLAPGCEMLMLIKPQFELQPIDIGKNGLVKDKSAYKHVEAKLRKALDKLGFTVRDWFESPIAGGDGNKEFFVWAQLPADWQRPAPVPAANAAEDGDLAEDEGDDE